MTDLYARSIVRLALVLAGLLLAVGPASADRASLRAAADAILEAMGERIAGADVTIVSLDLPARAPVTAVVTLRVIADHVVTARALGRGETVAQDDVRVVRGELREIPLRRLPVASQVVGRRVLRPIPAETVVLPGAVAVRRAVEPGDIVTAVAVSGPIEVSAMLTATDGGDPGDVIRVVNGDTRKSLRGRVVKEGLVEVGYAR